MTNRKNWINDKGENRTEKQAFIEILDDAVYAGMENSVSFIVAEGKRHHKGCYFVHYNVIGAKPFEYYLRRRRNNEVNSSKINDLIDFWLKK